MECECDTSNYISLIWNITYIIKSNISCSRSELHLFSGRIIADGHGLSRSAPATERSPMLPTRERLKLSLENDISRHTKFRGESFYFIIFSFANVAQNMQLYALT